MKRREDRRYLIKKKISGKAIAAIIAALAVVGIAVYLIISISKQVVNIDISGYNEVSITSGGERGIFVTGGRNPGFTRVSEAWS